MICEFGREVFGDRYSVSAVFEPAEEWPADTFVFVWWCARLDKADRVPLIDQSAKLSPALTEFLFF